MTRDEIRAKFQRMVQDNPRVSTDRYHFIASWKDWFQPSHEEDSAREFLESLLERETVRRMAEGAKDGAEVLLPSLFAQCKSSQLGKDPEWVCWALLTWAQALRLIQPGEVAAFQARLLPRGMAAAAGAGASRSSSVGTVASSVAPPTRTPTPPPAAVAVKVPSVTAAVPKVRVPWTWAIALGAVLGAAGYRVSSGELSLSNGLAIEWQASCAGWVSECPAGEPAGNAAPARERTVMLRYRGARSGTALELSFSAAGQPVHRARAVLEGTSGLLPVHVRLRPGEYRLSVASGGVEVFSGTLNPAISYRIPGTGIAR